MGFLFASILTGVGYVIVHTSFAASPGVAASNPLPFNMPSGSVLKSSTHKVFAHYFTPYPLSIDNKPSDTDYYTNGYLNPNGEGGVHAAYGGFLRERPLAQPVGNPNTYQLDNMKTEVQRATNAGLDGFTVDILSLTGYNWDRLKLMIQAAPLVDPNFKIVLMPDGTSSDTQDPAALAASIASIASSPALYHLSDGRLVISPFAPERQGAAWWQAWINTMQSQYGISIAFMPCFLNYTANAAAFDSMSFGFSNWGNRSPQMNTNLAANITDAHNRGKIWMQPVSLQDNRPRSKIYFESNNTENYRTTWNAAIAGADWVQIPTWNDYSEGAEIAPSTHTGWSPLDLTSYFLTRFKTGTWPSIVRDTMYLSHRVQFAATAPNPAGGETQLMSLAAGSSPPRDKVEVLSFLTAPGTVEATIGGQTFTASVAAGMTSTLFDLKSGSIAARVTRASNPVVSVDSPYLVKTDFPVQDEHYYFVSSGREGLVYPVTSQTPVSSVSPAPKIGDCNSDGIVNVVDLSLVLSHWTMSYPACDFNHDGIISVFDLSLLLGHWNGVIAANYNQIAVIGDSLTYMNGNGTTWLTAALTSLGWKASDLKIDGLPSRSIDGTESGAVTPTTIQVIDPTRASGFDPRVWVIALGTNNYTQDPNTQWPPRIQAVINKINSGPAANYQIYWIGTGFRDLATDHSADIFQAKLHSFATVNSNFHVCDYNDFVSSKRSATDTATWSSWWMSDGIHNTSPSGYQALRVPFYSSCISSVKP